MGARGPFLVMRGEMLTYGNQGDDALMRQVPTLVALELDAETAKAAGWAPVGEASA
jgi:hypothetical protein